MCSFLILDEGCLLCYFCYGKDDVVNCWLHLNEYNSFVPVIVCQLDTAICASPENSVALVISWITSKKIWKLTWGYCFRRFSDDDASQLCLQRQPNEYYCKSFLCKPLSSCGRCWMFLWHSSLQGLPAQSLQLCCLGRDALAQTGSEVESSWQLHLPTRSCWHAHLSLDLELPKQDVIEANSFAGHLLPLGFFPSLFFWKGKNSSPGLQMSNAFDGFRKCAFFHELQLIKQAIIRSMLSLMISLVNSFQSVQKSALN